jgi:glycosyltransferase involved in cell wall biosynthesis
MLLPTSLVAGDCQDAPLASETRGMRILLAIHTAYTDPTSGAARSVRTIVEWLAAAGHDCRVLATVRFDGLAPVSIDQHLAELDVAIEPADHSLRLGGMLSAWGEHGDAKPTAFQTPTCVTEPPAIQFTLRGVPVTMLLTRHNRLDQPDRAESRQFLAVLDDVVRQFEPDLLFTYGGHPVVQESMRHARERGITTLFTMRRAGYEDPFWFRHADHVLCAGSFLAEHYRRAIGLESLGIEPPIDWSDAMASDDSPPPESREFITFVNPSLQKGAAFFARLADVLGSQRPDIPIMVVESAMDSRVLRRLGAVNLAQYSQIVAGPTTSCPADYFALTKILLVPSLCDEAFARVAVEALINGIPPLVSDRGGLRQAVRGAGRVLPVPAWMTPAGVELPSESEVEPWFREICELWDDPALYAAASALARQTAETFYAEPLMRRRYVDYFESLPTKHNRLNTATKENADVRTAQLVS